MLYFLLRYSIEAQWKLIKGWPRRLLPYDTVLSHLGCLEVVGGTTAITQSLILHLMFKGIVTHALSLYLYMIIDYML